MLLFDQEDKKYLDGSLFSSIYVFRLKGESKPQTRLECLKTLVKDKSIVHFGCVDHLPLITQRRQSGNWLHEVLEQSATRVVGIDINEEGIAYMNREGFEAYVSNVVTEDIPAPVRTKRWDYLLAGEVLEHIGNPVEFLANIRQKYGAVTDRIVITVPNALSYTSIRFALRDEELINTDHRFWFTPYTLAKVATDAGITVEGFELCLDEYPSPWSLKYWLIRRRPNLRNRIVMVGRLN